MGIWGKEHLLCVYRICGQEGGGYRHRHRTKGEGVGGLGNLTKTNGVDTRGELKISAKIATSKAVDPVSIS